MEYTYLDLLCYLILYSFMGWIAEVVVVSITTRGLRNRGFFNLPFCLSYGIVMDLLIITFPTMEGNIVMMYVAALVISSVVTFLSGSISKRISRTIMWDYQTNNLFAGTKMAFLYALLQGLIFLLVLLLIQPLVYLLSSITPRWIKIMICIAVGALLLCDFTIILITLRRRRTQEEMDELLTLTSKNKRRISERLTTIVWRRINKAYPNAGRVEDAGGAEVDEKPAVFAKGICLTKLVWVFLIAALVGDLIETVFVWIRFGTLMSRSSLIYGPFSVVWGFGAVILTFVLYRLANKNVILIFLFGCLIGGIYEYLCSVATEVFLGTTFWDYSDLPFNFGGRTNLLFCMFWGLLAVAWIKWLYPIMSRLIEKIPPVVGTVLTWVIVMFFVLDCVLTIAVMLRYVDRAADPEVHNIIQQFLDTFYPDSLVEKRWQNLVVTE